MRFLDHLASVSHPRGRSWCAGLSIVNRPDFKNVMIAEYDSETIWFDHSLQFALGSSGAALINIEGRVAGIQSGEVVATYLALDGEPV